MTTLLKILFFIQELPCLGCMAGLPPAWLADVWSYGLLDWMWLENCSPFCCRVAESIGQLFPFVHSCSFHSFFGSGADSSMELRLCVDGVSIVCRLCCLDLVGCSVCSVCTLWCEAVCSCWGAHTLPLESARWWLQGECQNLPTSAYHRDCGFPLSLQRMCPCRRRKQHDWMGHAWGDIDGYQTK